MQIKIFQLNILKGLYLDRIIAYLKQNQFDVICLQEVTGGELGKNNKIDCFSKIKNALNYKGEILHDLQLLNDPSSYFSNAIYWKENYSTNTPIIISQINVNPNYQQILKLQQWKNIPRHCFGIKFTINQKSFYVFTAHAPWSKYPNDSLEKIEFTTKISEYLQTLKEPFILTGDFNMESSSQTIQIINNVTNNLIDKYKITNTLNPRVHYAAKEVFPPGLAVDYIFASKKMKVNNFNVINKPDLSDHYGLSTEVEI